jgi:F-type H+-transporting ATPase subunit b
LDQILHQLGDLFLRSVPTAVLFLLLVAVYRLLVHAPLERVLAERRERTTGAVAKAEAAIRAADARSQEYEAKLRAARAEIFHAREQRLQALQRERDRVLEEARHASHETVRTARQRLEAETAAARSALEAKTEVLAAEIVRAIVPSASSVGAAPLPSTQGSVY